MKTIPARPILLIAPLILAAGCVSMTDYEAEQMEQRENTLIVKEDMGRLSGRLETVELELDRIRAAVESGQATQAKNAQGQLQTLQARIDELDSRLRNLEAQRERDKKEIVDTLSGNISKIMSRSSSSSAARQNKRTADSGYEHEIQNGESLSAIAAAYGTTVKAIMDNNDIKDPNKVRVGQKLFIPE